MKSPARKILFVITKSNWGGAQQYVRTLATHFTDAGDDVVVALGGTGDAGAAAGLLAERLANAGVRTILVRAFMRNISFFHELRTFFELLRIIRAEKPDILHLNSSKAGGLGALAGRIAGVPRIIFTAHGWAHKEKHRPLYQRASIWLASWLTAQLCHKIIVLSEADWYAAPTLFSRRKMTIIGNGVHAFPLLTQAEARTRLIEREPRIASYPRLIMSTSELHRNKGLDVLIAAFVRVAQNHPDTALVLMHSGEEREALMAQAQAAGLAERVFFLGFVPDARSLLSAAALFVIPSRKEGLPFGLLEAGQARLPVIATDIGTIAEVIEDGVSGLLVAPEDDAALASAIERLLTDEALSEHVRYALHARIIRDFSEEAMLRETAAAYRS